MPLALASPSAPTALVDASEAVSARDWAVAAMRAALISAIVGRVPVAPCPAASRRPLAIDTLRLLIWRWRVAPAVASGPTARYTARAPARVVASPCATLVQLR